MWAFMGFIHSLPLHVPFLPVQIEGLWGGSALIKHNGHLSTVDLRDSRSKSLTKPDTETKSAGDGRGVKCMGGCSRVKMLI